MKKITNECNSGLIFINLGLQKHAVHELENFNNYKDFFKENSINYIDLFDNVEIIRKNKSKYSIKNDGHPNKLANEIIYKSTKTKISKFLD